MKRIVFALFLLSGIVHAGFTQNLYDFEHSCTYARFLLHDGQTAEGLQELKRIAFQFENDSVKAELIRQYYQLNMYDSVLRVYERLRIKAHSSDYMRQRAEKYFAGSLMWKGYHKPSMEMLKNSVLSPESRDAYLAANCLLMHDTARARALIALYLEQAGSAAWFKMAQLNGRVAKMRYKSPFTAAMLSAVVPGSGKWYAGRGRDGLYSLLFVSMFSWQAYRGFHKRGTESVYGWISLGAAIGFYSGGIYGSAKAARVHNSKKRNEIRQELQAILAAF